MATRPLFLSLLFALAACSDGRTADPTAKVDAEQQQARNQAEAAEQGKIDEIETGVRLRALQAQVDALQQEVGAIKNTRQSLDLDLLNQRLAAVEAKLAANSGGAPSPTARPPATPRPMPSPTRQPTPRASSTPKPNDGG